MKKKGEILRNLRGKSFSPSNKKCCKLTRVLVILLFITAVGPSAKTEPNLNTQKFFMKKVLVAASQKQNKYHMQNVKMLHKSFKVKLRMWHGDIVLQVGSPNFQ